MNVHGNFHKSKSRPGQKKGPSQSNPNPAKPKPKPKPVAKALGDVKKLVDGVQKPPGKKKKKPKPKATGYESPDSDDY